LVSKGFLSVARLDEVRRAVEMAQAQAGNAYAQRKALSDQGTEVVQARAQISLAGSTKAAAASRLTQTVIRAPGDAKVLTRLVEPGQIVQPAWVVPDAIPEERFSAVRLSPARGSFALSVPHRRRP
jgi:HlyD family secretion protein